MGNRRLCFADGCWLLAVPCLACRAQGERQDEKKRREKKVQEGTVGRPGLAGKGRGRAAGCFCWLAVVARVWSFGDLAHGDLLWIVEEKQEGFLRG